MVKSKISNISYVENSTIEPNDDNFKTNCIVSPIKLENPIDILVCFGSDIRSPHSNVYRYKSLYIVKDRKAFKKIGCYEFHVHNKDNIFIKMEKDEMTFDDFKKYGELLIFESVVTLDLLNRCAYTENDESLSIKINAKAKNQNEDDDDIININDDDNNHKEQYNADENDDMDTSVTPKSLDNDHTLFTDDIVFTFHIRSADVKPGKGINETITVNDTIQFENLNKIKHWRRILSNFYIKSENNQVVHLFKDEEHSWASTEHYFQAQKFKKFPEYYKLFSLESGTELSKSAKYAKEVGEKGKLNNKKYMPNEVYSLKDDTNQEINMETAQRMKYNQDHLSKDVLIATKNAKLQHMPAQKKSSDAPIVFYDTMRIRKELVS